MDARPVRYERSEASDGDVADRVRLADADEEAVGCKLAPLSLGQVVPDSTIQCGRHADDPSLPAVAPLAAHNANGVRRTIHVLDAEAKHLALPAASERHDGKERDIACSLEVSSRPLVVADEPEHCVEGIARQEARKRLAWF